MTVNILAEAMKASFENWLKKDLKYKKLQKSVTPAMYRLIYKAFEELDNYRPATYDLWFVINHMQFKEMRQTEKHLVGELMYNFLTKYTRNELESKSTGYSSDTAEAGNKRKKKA